MEKRLFERINVNVEVEFFSNENLYCGTVNNISEKGMFIRTKRIYFPFDMQFEMRIPWEEKIVYLPVNLNRMSTSPDSSDALAVEIAEPSPQYLEFLSNLRVVCKY